jgi:poly-gamma-glutamate synthesis protein (capsule biosynthesis protein)
MVVGGGVLLGMLAFGVLGDLSAGSTSSPFSATTAPPKTSEPSVVTATTVSATSTVPAAIRPERVPITIQAVGDVNFDPTYIDSLRVHGYGYAFEKLDGVFLADDLSIVNLECAPSTLGTPLDKDFVFQCPPSSLAAAKANGVDVVNLANNHSQDYGKTAMLDGLTQARLAGLGAVGVGADIDQATSPFLVEVHGWRVAVLGMGGVKPSDSWVATADHPGMADGDDIDQMTQSVRDAARSADLVFVSIHWGVEGESEPRDDDRKRAQAMIEAGADAIFGHHPHRLGALEFIDGVPVFWTLGNFVWPKFSDLSATTGVARLEIDADRTIRACLLPAFIQAPGQPQLTGPTECSGPR